MEIPETRLTQQEREGSTTDIPESNSVSARFLKIPRELLLALINATAILVMAAAIFLLIAISRINHFAGDVMSTMTDSVLSQVDLPSSKVLGNLKELTAEVRTLRSVLEEIKSGERPLLQSEVARLKEALTALSVSVDRLRNVRSILTDEAMARLGRSVSETLIKLRDCSSQVAPYDASKVSDSKPTFAVAAVRHHRWSHSGGSLRQAE